MAVLSRFIKALAVFLGLRPWSFGPFDPARLAATALLIRVARGDGTLGAAELERIEELAGERFCASGREAKQLVRKARSLDDETVEVSALIDMLGRDEVLRRDVLRLAFRVADADGAIREVEDDLVWRLGAMLGFDDAEIATLKETDKPKAT